MSSVCAIGGYALETRYVHPRAIYKLFLIPRSCHLGKVIRYDTVSKMNWSVSVRTHPIKVVIESILQDDWDPKNGREVPVAEEQTDCVVCLPYVTAGVHVLISDCRIALAGNTETTRISLESGFLIGLRRVYTSLILMS